MSVPTEVSADPRFAELHRIWCDSVRSVLAQVAGFPVTVEPATEAEFAAAQGALERQPVWQLFAASKALQGEMAILTAERDAVPLAQILVSEPIDAGVAFESDCRDAYRELLNQVLGYVAIGLKAIAGGEVELKPAGDQAPSWPEASRSAIRVTAEKFQPIHLVLVATSELLQSFHPAPEGNAPGAEEAEKIEAPAAEQPELSAARSSNLELLLDVKLDATIRFGQKQMLLREILELHPGSAVALDRQVEEPVELLVGGRMVAWGEVVIVDGNYGLRITEILSPQQRLESLRTGT